MLLAVDGIKIRRSLILRKGFFNSHSQIKPGGLPGNRIRIRVIAFRRDIGNQVIDQKTLSSDPADRVRNPGGYLREMTARAKKGELNLHGSVFGLLKRGEGEHDA